MFVLGFTLYATTVLLPQLLQSLMGYTAESAGMAMSSGGLATIICMPIVGILISRVDGRYLIMFGFASIAVAALPHDQSQSANELPLRRPFCVSINPLDWRFSSYLSIP
jgi:MFS family permease